MGHIVLDLTSLAHEPKFREQFAYLERPVTSALSEQKIAYPADTRELDEDEDDQPLVRSDCNASSGDEDYKPLVQTVPIKEPMEERRHSAAGRRIPVQVRKRKGPPVWQDPSATLETDVSGNSRDQKKSRFREISQMVKLSAAS